MIPLADIDMISNYRDVEPVKPTDADVIELSNSIKNNGLLQAVLVRPHPARAGRYELIFGHRRNVAAGLAGLKEIPCNVKDVSDEDILELQVTENLQRKDVHPLDEAIAFMSLIRDKNYTIEDIAARFGKKVEFVTHRLKLNDLMPDLQKPFKKGLISVGQAFVICRLRQEDQKVLRKEWSDEDFPGSSISDVQVWINRNLLRQLSSASFKRDDATLDAKAGPCTTCQKRSGCGNLLFTDLTEDDRCFDATCFERKSDAFFVRQLQKNIETHPEVHLVADQPDKLPKEVKDLLRQMNVKPLKSDQYQRYGGYGKFKKQAKGFFLDGHYRGKTDSIYVEGAAKKEVKGTDGKGVVKRTIADIDQEIAGIKERQKRAKELDLEKIQKATLEQLQARKDLRKPGLPWCVGIDRGIMVYLLLHKAASYQAKDEIRKNIKSIPKYPTERYSFKYDYIKELGAISDDDLATMIRIICLEEWGNPKIVTGIDDTDTTLRLIAHYSGIDLIAIENAVDIEATKRIERADKRVKALREEKKELEAKAKEKADKKQAAGKTAKEAPTAAAAKKSSTKKSGKTKLSAGIKSLLNQKEKGLLEDDDPLGLNIPGDKRGDDPDDWK